MAVNAQKLAGRVALVAGGTRGAGRGIAVELGAAGAVVYVTGRTTNESASPMGRRETIEEPLTSWTPPEGPVWPSGSTTLALTKSAPLSNGSRTTTAGSTCWSTRCGAGTPSRSRTAPSGSRTSEMGWRCSTTWSTSTIVEVTDGVSSRYRGSLFYDLAKSAVSRLALAQGEDLRARGVAVVALTPGFLRSEAVLEHFGVTAAGWRAAIAKDPHFAFSETPHYIGRAVMALAADPAKLERTGTVTAMSQLAKDYGFTDVDGTRPDWGQHAVDALGWST